jgi:hypothetical protein
MLTQKQAAAGQNNDPKLQPKPELKLQPSRGYR